MHSKNRPEALKPALWDMYKDVTILEVICSTMVDDCFQLMHDGACIMQQSRLP